MNETQEVFSELNSLSERGTKNNSVANEARTLFERALKIKLGIPREKYVLLKNVFDEYIDRYKPDGIKYNGIELIKELNKFSHDTPIKLSSEKLNDNLSKLNKILEVIFETSNKKILPTELSPNINNDCNAKQLEAVKSNSLITLVQAGPGTGKTYLIVERIIRIGNNDSNKRIVGLSFTNQAAINLKQRFEYKIFGTRQQKDLREKIFIGTIHSFAFDSLKRFSTNELKIDYDYSIIDEEEYKELKTEFNNNMSMIKNYLLEHKLLTFKDILEEFKNKLLDNNNFKRYIVEDIQEIIIDEAQDLDEIQYEIFKELQNYSHAPHLFLVGDQRQNIFDFAGGNIKHLLNSFDNSKIKNYSLSKSYRCPNRVLNFVNSFTFNDCENTFLMNEEFEGSNPIFEEAPDKIVEAEKIVNLVTNNLVKNSLAETVILAPSSFYFTEIANKLNEAELPFRIFGGETILKPQMRLLINVLKAIVLQKKYPLLKVISFWDSKLKIGSKDFHQMLSDLNSNNLNSHWGSKLLLTIKFIKNNLEGRKIAIELAQEFTNYCKNNNIFNSDIIVLYQKFYKLLNENELFNIDEINIKLTPNNDEFSSFYNKTADIKCKTEVNNNSLTLSTIHSAKGKEWDIVIIPGLSQDIFPRYNSDFNAELKKFYVACTRTKKQLYFFRPESYTVPKKDGSGVWTFSKPKSVFFNDVLY